MNIPVDVIVHLSDIHIRPLKRHEEFQAVFQETIGLIKKIREQAVICITGDLFDNKSTFHPETFKLGRDFLKGLAAIFPVFIIAGNHDMYENNQQRLDAITPIAEDIPNLHYLKYSGEYAINPEVTFVVSSLYDKKFIRKADIRVEPGRKYIALYHGAITGSTTDMNHEIKEVEGGVEGSTRYRTLADFTGFDAVLLGDIHKHQARKVPEGGWMAYAGSLIQQNHGEPLSGHGFLVWDRELKYTFYPVPNVYGFIDIQCENGMWTNKDLYYIPRKCYARLIIRNCTDEQLNLIIAQVKERVDTLFVEKRQCLSDNIKEAEIPPDLQRVEDETGLIAEMAQELKLPAEDLIALHLKYQSELDLAGGTMNTAVWKPLKLEFKNLFGYGGNIVNRINFSTGVTCISAANANGKTSLVNIMLYGIFGRTPLNPSGANYTFDVVHTTCDNGYVKIWLNYGGEFYLIERKSVKRKKAAAGVSLNRLSSYEFTCGFWRTDEEGAILDNLQDTRKKNTDTALTELFGDITDFSLANLLNKESALDLLTMTPAEQIKTLKRLFRLEVYDGYREVNKKYLTEVEKEIAEQMYQKQYAEAELARKEPPPDTALLATEAEECQDILHQMTENLQGLYQEQSGLMEQLNRLKGQFTPNLPELDPADLRSLIRKRDEMKLIPLTSNSVSAAELAYRIKFLQTQSTAMSLLDLEAECKLLSAAGIIESEGNINKIYLTIDRLANQIQALPNISSDLFPERTLEEIQTERQKVVLTPVSSNYALVKARIAELEDEEEQFEGVSVEWLKENSRQQQVVLKRLTGLKGDLTHFDLKRSKTHPAKSREELQASLSLNATPYANLKDISPMKKLKTEIEGLTEVLNRGERGRLQNLMSLLEQPKLLLAERQLIRTYLEEKYTGVYDATITVGLNRMAELEKSYQNYVLYQETNERIVANRVLEGEIAEWDYRTTMKNIRTAERELEELQMEQTILTSQQVLQEREKQLALLRQEEALHVNNQVAKMRLEVLQQSSDYKTAHALKQELAELELTGKAVRLREVRQALQAHRELESLQRQYTEQELYETFQALEEKIRMMQLIKINEKLKLSIRDYEANCADIQADIHTQQTAITDSQTRLADLTQALKLSQYKLEEYNGIRANLGRISDATIQLQKRIRVYEHYAKLMSNRGIACRLLFTKIKSIEAYINRITAQFTKYQIHILYDDAKQTISILTENKTTHEHLSIQRLSGFEKLMLQIAFKRALNKFSYNSKSSVIIIDEALDCIDADNFQSKLPEVMNMIAQDYAMAIAISQRDISHISDRAIRIKIENGNSFII